MRMRPHAIDAFAVGLCLQLNHQVSDVLSINQPEIGDRDDPISVTVDRFTARLAIR